MPHQGMSFKTAMEFHHILSLFLSEVWHSTYVLLSLDPRMKKTHRMKSCTITVPSLTYKLSEKENFVFINHQDLKVVSKI